MRTCDTCWRTAEHSVVECITDETVIAELCFGCMAQSFGFASARSEDGELVWLDQSMAELDQIFGWSKRGYRWMTDAEISIELETSFQG